MKVIITGTTGMVGEGVLLECLSSNIVSEVLVINRRPCGVTHIKLKEIIHSNFHDLSPIENHLSGYDACFFCAGVSSVGMKEEQYQHLTYDLTLHVAKILSKLNSNMVFCYVSGKGTNANGSMMWQKVKGNTENDLLKLSFKAVYNFRPGIIEPIKGQKNTLKIYTYLGWLMPVIKILSPSNICSLKDIAAAMINSVIKGYEKNILEVKDIVALAKR
ncbi:MAG: epimerase [Chitinophaga sp.]|jgi:uncharacterized protein YbjT (DUF2867 family)|nr:epimerase [Chitinophaga sp.]